MLIWAVLWLVCGVFSYGVSKGQILNECLIHGYKYTREDEISNLIMLAIGPFSLMVVMLMFILGGYGFSLLCFCMPKKLCAKHSKI